MAAAKPDMTHLEALVGQGRHAEALDGYLKLLTNRPTDPLLRARVEMLREALAQEADQFIPAGDTDPKSTYVVTPEEVADSYVLAGRYDDAILILEKILVQRPADRQVMDRLDRVKKLKTSGVSEGAESTTPQQEFVAPPHTPSKPLGRPAPGPAPIFGQPKSGVGKGVQQSHASAGRSPGSAMHRPVVDKPAAAGPVEMVRVNSSALAAAPAFGTPRSLGGSRRPARDTDPVGAAVQSLANRKDTAPTTPVVTDDPSSTGDRTVLSPPPQPLRKAQVLVDPTRVAAPPDRLLRASKSEPTDPLPPEPDFTTTPGMAAQQEELTRPAIGLPAGMADDEDDNARTAATDAPEGLAEALAFPEGSATRLVPLPVVHDERTWASPPPVHEPDPPARKPAPPKDKPRKR